MLRRFSAELQSKFSIYNLSEKASDTQYKDFEPVEGLLEEISYAALLILISLVSLIPWLHHASTPGYRQRISQRINTNEQ